MGGSDILSSCSKLTFTGIKRLVDWLQRGKSLLPSAGSLCGFVSEVPPPSLSSTERATFTGFWPCDGHSFLPSLLRVLTSPVCGGVESWYTEPLMSFEDMTLDLRGTNQVTQKKHKLINLPGVEWQTIKLSGCRRVSPLKTFAEACASSLNVHSITQPDLQSSQWPLFAPAPTSTSQWAPFLLFQPVALFSPLTRLPLWNLHNSNEQEKHGPRWRAADLSEERTDLQMALVHEMDSVSLKHSDTRNYYIFQWIMFTKKHTRFLYVDVFWDYRSLEMENVPSECHLPVSWRSLNFLFTGRLVTYILRLPQLVHILSSFSRVNSS